MQDHNLKKLANWLALNNLTERRVADYSREEIERMVEFILKHFATEYNCPVLTDGAQRLIVPANASKDQLRGAIKVIERMIEYPDTESIEVCPGGWNA